GSRSTSLTTSHQPLATNSNPQSLIPNPLFSVRTPTALVTDLGTEFGVEVGEEGTTTSHVFRGSVKVLVLDADGNLPSPSGRGAGGEGDGREVILGENESVRVQHGKDAEARLVIVRGPVPGKVDGFVRSLQPDTTRIVEKFDGAKLGAAFEQNPPGRYVNELGAAVYQQPPATDGRQSRGYIRTVATDFCDRDFVFEATFQFHLDAPDRQLLRHRIFFGIGDGVPNSNFYDEVTCGLVLALVLDEGRAFVELCHPDSVAGRDDVKIVAEMAPLTSLRSGKHRFRLWKKGKWVTFAVDADFKGQFLGAFAGRPIDLSVAAPLLDAANSRLLVGTGNCDVMTVRFEELSATYTETKNEQREISPTGTTKSPERGK
ncbi:MAG: FecR family protein, partial [Planctomycetales bacterium]|nr:FecR family protein [Planctomycetales bacterium]